MGLELESITAAALGGTAMTGGKGTVLGTVLGVLIIGVLNNGMILLGVSQFYQFIARGVLLILAVLIQRWLKGKTCTVNPSHCEGSATPKRSRAQG